MKKVLLTLVTTILTTLVFAQNIYYNTSIIRRYTDPQSMISEIKFLIKHFHTSKEKQRL